MADREQVARFAEQHGMVAAAKHFRVPVNSVKGWTARYRAAKRAGKAVAREPGQLTPAERDQLAALLAARMASGTPVCLHCAGTGEVRVPAVVRAGVTIRFARRFPCPTCGGIPRRVVITEWPKDAWAEQMALAGDLGVGWLPWEWQRIRTGEPNPAGQRFTHHDRLEPMAEPPRHAPYRNPFKEARR